MLFKCCEMFNQNTCRNYAALGIFTCSLLWWYRSISFFFFFLTTPISINEHGIRLVQIPILVLLRPFDLSNMTECMVAIYCITYAWKQRWLVRRLLPNEGWLHVVEWWQRANDLEEWNRSFVVPHDGYISDGRWGFRESNKELLGNETITLISMSEL